MGRQTDIKGERFTMQKPSGMAMPAASSSNSIIIICMSSLGSCWLYMHGAGVLYEQLAWEVAAIYARRRCWLHSMGGRCLVFF